VKVAGGSLYVAGRSDGQAWAMGIAISHGAYVSEFAGGVVVTTTPCTGRPGPSSSKDFLISAASMSRANQSSSDPAEQPIVAKREPGLGRWS
jgi:hypothetical protein